MRARACRTDRAQELRLVRIARNFCSDWIGPDGPRREPTPRVRFAVASQRRYCPLVHERGYDSAVRCGGMSRLMSKFCGGWRDTTEGTAEGGGGPNGGGAPACGIDLATKRECPDAPGWLTSSRYLGPGSPLPKSHFVLSSGGSGVDAAPVAAHSTPRIRSVWKPALCMASTSCPRTFSQTRPLP